jgi:hypothetical protein
VEIDELAEELNNLYGHLYDCAIKQDQEEDEIINSLSGEQFDFLGDLENFLA